MTSRIRRVAVGALSVAALSVPLVAATAGTADAATYHYKSCAQLHKHFKHGVGKAHAKDHTSGTPVRNFKHSTKVYRAVVKYRAGLDRDHDGIACEAH